MMSTIATRGHPHTLACTARFLELWDAEFDINEGALSAALLRIAFKLYDGYTSGRQCAKMDIFVSASVGNYNTYRRYLDDAEARGWITYAAHPRDKRSTLIAITPLLVEHLQNLAKVASEKSHPSD